MDKTNLFVILLLFVLVCYLWYNSKNTCKQVEAFDEGQDIYNSLSTVNTDGSRKF